MTDMIDRSLDDIVTEKYKKRNAERRQQRDNRTGVRGRGGFRGSSRGRGGYNNNYRGGYNTGKNYHTNRPAPRSGPLYTSNYGQGNSYGGSVKVLVSNLDPGVSPKDVRELYSEFGPTEKLTLNYDRSGRSQGTAEIWFTNKSDAMRAMHTYNGVPLDGKPMVVEVIGGSSSFRKSRNFQDNNYQSGDYEISYAASKTRPGYVDHDRPAGEGRNVYNKGPRNNNYRGRGTFRGGRGGSRIAGDQKPSKSEEDLDKELDSYLSKRAL